MTYNDIYNEFCEKFPDAEVDSYESGIFVPIPNAILVSFKDGSKFIYVSSKEDK